MKTWLSWSSGKDSAWALEVLRRAGQYRVEGLLTTVNEAFERVAMHAVRRSLVEQQARSVGIPLVVVPLPWPCSNEEYERRMKSVCERAIAQGVEAIAFGDLFLEDVRRYREKRLSGTGLEPVFPLWQQETLELAREMIDSGLEARLTCVDPRAVDPDLVGRRLDHELLDLLPDSVDPCGENGEFHTFVTGGPMLDRPIGVRPGEVVERDGFVFADLLPEADSPARSG